MFVFVFIGGAAVDLALVQSDGGVGQSDGGESPMVVHRTTSLSHDIPSPGTTPSFSVRLKRQASTRTRNRHPLFSRNSASTTKIESKSLFGARTARTPWRKSPGVRGRSSAPPPSPARARGAHRVHRPHAAPAIEPLLEGDRWPCRGSSVFGVPWTHVRLLLFAGVWECMMPGRQVCVGVGGGGFEVSLSSCVSSGVVYRGFFSGSLVASENSFRSSSCIRY